MRLTTLDAIVVRVIRIAGLGGVIWETLGEHVDRPYLLFLFACMMGLARWDNITSMISPGSGSVLRMQPKELPQLSESEPLSITESQG